MLELGIRKYSTYGKIGIMGDLNARCGTNDDFILETDVFEKYIPFIDNSNDEEIISINNRSSLDKICNASGVKLLDICKSTDIRIVNGRIGDDLNIGNSLIYLH